MITKNKAQCRKCQDVIESTHQHDFKWCKCKSIFVDGGRHYIRRGGDPASIIDLTEFAKPDEEKAAESAAKIIQGHM